MTDWNRNEKTPDLGYHVPRVRAPGQSNRRVVPRVRRSRTAPLIGPLLFHLYRVPLSPFRNVVRGLLYHLEGGSAFSATLRRIFSAYYGVEVGLYTHGAWMVPFNFDRGTTVGRYCTIAWTVRTITQNHPMNTKSTNSLFFDPHYGLVEKNRAPRNALTIGNDVWIGHNAVILPGVTVIGDGAVIGAGAVVHQNVPPFGIVVGHPGRVVGYRFSKELIQELLASKWWDKSLDELLPELDDFLTPLEGTEIR
jgi:virginiamycin A acetyltransferase